MHLRMGTGSKASWLLPNKMVTQSKPWTQQHILNAIPQMESGKDTVYTYLNTTFVGVDTQHND